MTSLFRSGKLRDELELRVVEARNLVGQARREVNAFVEVRLKGHLNTEKQVSGVIWGKPNPVWNQDFVLHPTKFNDLIQIKVYDKQLDQLLGMAEVAVAQFFGKGIIEACLPLVNKAGLRLPGEVHIIGHFVSAVVYPPLVPCSSMQSYTCAPQYTSVWADNRGHVTEIRQGETCYTESPHLKYETYAIPRYEQTTAVPTCETITRCEVPVQRETITVEAPEVRSETVPTVRYETTAVPAPETVTRCEVEVPEVRDETTTVTPIQYPTHHVAEPATYSQVEQYESTTVVTESPSSYQVK